MKKLNKLYFLKLEIDELKEELHSLTEIGSPSITGMPHSGKVSDPVSQYFMKKQRLIDKLNKKLDVYIDELATIENIIDKIEDPETRLIARLRFINNLKWEQISRKVHLDRSVCYRKIKKYL